jgi:hypothetical protein
MSGAVKPATLSSGRATSGCARCRGMTMTGVSPDLSRSIGHKSSRSRDTVRTRVIVMCTKQSHEPPALRTDLRQRMPAVVAGTLTIRASSHEMYERRKKESGTPIDAGPYPRHLCALCKARSPIGVPPRLFANGTIHPEAQPGPGFVTHAAHAAGPPPARVAHPAMHIARRS